ncbi:hypothetical protein [Alkaliphilus serpentinus]|uniref:DUF8052 domain-containing protein n=1 Tax=Alkaliphilus serpentinus TaxID=1482731 RepID=A0A833M979_9FIRM|nr:hypothetical protein [Alkaliphilus serpentinus]KAB3527195.1 hypothetical protein F8153_12795 [Alkaliphilus serpentinus]
MRGQEYIDKVTERLRHSFDILREYDVEGICFDVFASSYIRSERYFASKKIKVYGIENHEYCLIKRVENLSYSVLKDLTDGLVKASEALIKPHHEHMSTIITGVLVVEGKVEDNLRNQIKGFQYSKSFLWGLKGWTYIRLLVVDIEDSMVYSNRRGKEVLRFYEVF